MAAYMPQNQEEFFKIKGVGKKKYDSYGKEFINLINEYIVEEGLDVSEIRRQLIDTITAASSIDRLKEDTETNRYEQTYNFYLKGLSLKEIALERNLTQNTIINHLSRCEKQGKTIDWSRFIEPEKEEQIIEMIEKVGNEKLKPIKEALPQDITYEDIRLVLCKCSH